MIGFFPGTKWGTSEDELILVIAHWDTVNISPGFDDNGSGVAALLETARAIGESKCSFETSIILAAVDLEEVGTHGASAFVHDFLIEEILKPFNYSSVKVKLCRTLRQKIKLCTKKKDRFQHFFELNGPFR